MLQDEPVRGRRAEGWEVDAADRMDWEDDGREERSDWAWLEGRVLMARYFLIVGVSGATNLLYCQYAESVHMVAIHALVYPVR